MRLHVEYTLTSPAFSRGRRTEFEASLASTRRLDTGAKQSKLPDRQTPKRQWYQNREHSENLKSFLGYNQNSRVLARGERSIQQSLSHWTQTSISWQTQSYSRGFGTRLEGVIENILWSIFYGSLRIRYILLYISVYFNPIMVFPRWSWISGKMHWIYLMLPNIQFQKHILKLSHSLNMATLNRGSARQ